MTDLERYASLRSFRKALENAPEEGIILTNPVGNLNVYDKDDNWVGIISLRNIDIHQSMHPDEEPEASWEEM